MAEEELGNQVLLIASQEHEILQTHLSEDETQELSEFLAEFPKIRPLSYTKPNHKDGWWCFWSQTKTSQTNSSFYGAQTPDPWTIHNKIISALSNFRLIDGGLIQFWVPEIQNGRRLLKTFGQPFAVRDLDVDLAELRISCQNYFYDVDTEAQEVEDDNLIINGPPAIAFLNHLPLFNCKRYLTDCFSCVGDRHFIVLPIFDPDTTCCVGVLECCMLSFDTSNEHMLDELVAALKKADLISLDTRECRPCDSIDGLRHARDEYEVALETVCVTHHLGIAQAWIQYDYKNHVPFSSFKEHNFDFMQNKLVPAFKLLNYAGECIEEFHTVLSNCDEVPLRIGEGFVGKALNNHEHYLCRRMSEFSQNEPSQSYVKDICGICFVICLKSTYTHNLDYVLEFFWYDDREVIILLTSILLTLKRTLPSFKIYTGEEIGNELCIKEITYSSEANECVVEDILISPQANKICPIEQQFGKTQIEVVENVNVMPSDKVVTTSQQESNTSKRKYKTSPISLDREIIECQFGKTQLEAAKELNVCLSTLKRKCKDVGINEWQGRPKSGKNKVSESQGEQNGKNRGDIQMTQGPLVINELIIKAEYKGDLTKFNLPSSTTILQAVQEEISKRFGLDRGTYKLKYYDEVKDLVIITCDEDFMDCVKSFRLMNSNTIRLKVLSFA